jgi:hypothetical protein
MKNHTFPKIRRSAMLLLALLAFGQTAWAQGLSGTGTSTDPYLINDSIDWNWFAQSVTDGTSYANQFVSLNDDITVGTMAGIENKCFSGTFDGQGHTITLDMTANIQFTSLFCYVDGATFQNLKVDGTINTSKKFCAGIAGGIFYNGCTFTNCLSEVTINSTINGDGTHGGLVAYVGKGDNTFEGCAFTGKLLGSNTNYVGGLVGFTDSRNNATVSFTNCVFHPQQVTMSGSGSQTFARWYGNNSSSVIIGSNCYYSQTLGAAQGKMMRSITGDANVTVAFDGQPTNYSVSGIDAYSAGIVYDSTLYAGNGDTVSLNLDCEVPWGYVFEGDYMAEPDASLSGTGNPYTLTMPNANVTIVPHYLGYTVSVECNPNIYGVVQVSLDNATWGTSVTTSVNDVVYFRFNTPDGYFIYSFFIETDYGVPVAYTDNHFSMPPANVTVHADLSEMGIGAGTDDVYTVTLSPGEGGGIPIIFNSTVLPMADNAESAQNLQFYHVNSTTIGFRLDNDYCPDSFTAPNGYGFCGWDNWNNNGYITLTSMATTFTAQWIEFEPYTVTLLPGIGGGEPIVYAFNPTTAAPNANSANICQFYYVNNTTIGFRLPADYCPYSFSAPNGCGFCGWDGWNNNGYFTLTSTATTFTARWEDLGNFTVTLSPGIGGGEPIVYAFDTTTAVSHPSLAETCQFYYEDNNTIGFRLPANYCPSSFVAPDGLQFLGWYGWNHNGYITLTSTSTTFTARWMIPINYIDGNGEMHTCTNYTVLTGGGATTLAAGWYMVDSDITYNDGIKLYYGDVNLILCNGKTMTVTTDHIPIKGFGHTLTIYGQSLDSIEAGTLNLNCTRNYCITEMTYIQHSGNVTVSSPNNKAGIEASSFTLNGGSLYASARVFGIAVNNDLTINGGTVTGINTENNSWLTSLSCDGNVIINGGKVETNKIYAQSNITLGWTNADDYIHAGSYETNAGTISVKSGQFFYYENDGGGQVIVSGTLNTDQVNAIAGKILRPYIEPITVTKDIAGYGTENGNWHLIASPMLDTIDPAIVGNLIPDTADHYDLYRFNPSHEGNEWENFKADSAFMLEAGQGYLYANTDTVALTFNGRPYVGNGKIELVYDSLDIRKCWNLVGNPFPCNATLDREYYVMNADGTGINPEPIPATTPIPPCTAVFVKSVAVGDKAVFTRVTP